MSLNKLVTLVLLLNLMSNHIENHCPYQHCRCRCYLYKLSHREFYFRDQDRIMLTNSIYIKNQLNSKRIEFYLKRITILIKRNKIKRLIRKKDRTTIINNY